jgi:hypothetical protein
MVSKIPGSSREGQWSPRRFLPHTGRVVLAEKRESDPILVEVSAEIQEKQLRRLRQ